MYGVDAQVDKLDKTVVGEEQKLRGKRPLFMLHWLGGSGSKWYFVLAVMLWERRDQRWTFCSELKTT